MLPGYDYSKAAENMENGIGGQLGFVSATTGKTLYLYYMATGINNWNILVSVSEDVVMKDVQAIKHTLYSYVAFEIEIMFAYVAYIIINLILTVKAESKLSMFDQTTKLLNRIAYDKYLKDNKDRQFEKIGCIFIDANGLHEINNKYDHSKGDQLLAEVGAALKEQFTSDATFRIGGDEFVAFCDNTTEEDFDNRIEKIASRLNKHHYSVSYGKVIHTNDLGLTGIVHEADEAMLNMKRTYYKNKNQRDVR